MQKGWMSSLLSRIVTIPNNMKHRELFPGQFIKFGNKSSARHWLGGRHSCEGAWCTNCELPLMLHLSIDCSDPSLSLSFMPCGELPLFYCMRCSLSWHDFSYRILADSEIEIIEEFRGETTWDEWYSDGGAGDVIERRAVQLAPIPARLRELYDRLNAGDDSFQVRRSRSGIVHGKLCSASGRRLPDRRCD